MYKPSRHANTLTGARDYADMCRLPPTYVYRLRLLISGPRFYEQNTYNRRLQKRGMIQPTGRSEPATNRAEYEITDAGRSFIAAKMGLSTPLDLHKK